MVEIEYLPGVRGKSDIPWAEHYWVDSSSDPAHQSVPTRPHCTGQLGSLSLNTLMTNANKSIETISCTISHQNSPPWKLSNTELVLVSELTDSATKW